MQGAIWSNGIFYSWHWILDLGLQWIRPPSSLTPEPQIPHRSHEGQLFFSANLVSHLHPPKIFTLLGTQTQKAKFRFKFTSLSVPTNISISLTSCSSPHSLAFSIAQKTSIFLKAGNLENKYGQTLPFGVLPAFLESIGSEDVAVVKQRRTQREKPVNTSVMTSRSLKHNKY